MTDIHCHPEKRTGEGWVRVQKPLRPFHKCGHCFCAFFGGIRNVWGITPIFPPRGFPHDASKAARYCHDDVSRVAKAASWATTQELLALDYDAALNGDTKGRTLREFLGERYMADLEAVKASGATRIVFWFSE